VDGLRVSARRTTLGEALAPLELGRTAALYLLALHAAGGACIAWGGVSGPGLVLLALALGAAAGLGLRAAAGFDRIERRERERGALLGALLYALVAGLGLGLAVVAPQPALLRRVALAGAAAQGVLLLLAGLDRRGLVALANALLLVVLAALRGGGAAAWAVAGAGLLIPFVLAFDHAAARLLAHPTRPTPVTLATARGAARFALPTAGLLLLAALLVPAPPYAVEALPLEQLRAMRAEIEAAYRRLVLLALFGVGGTLGLARLLRREDQGREAVFEGLESAVAEDEALPEVGTADEAGLAGSRGRVVRAYARLLANAAARGLRWRPADTPREREPRLGAARAAVRALTRLFEAARYGPADLDDDDARAAENASDDARRGLPPARGKMRRTP
jgi:hypothetical protein